MDLQADDDLPVAGGSGDQAFRIGCAGIDEHGGLHSGVTCGHVSDCPGFAPSLVQTARRDKTRGAGWIQQAKPGKGPHPWRLDV